MFIGNLLCARHSMKLAYIHMLLYSFNKATLQEEPRAPSLVAGLATGGAHSQRLCLSLHSGHFCCSFVLNLKVLNVFVGIKGIYCVYN